VVFVPLVFLAAYASDAGAGHLQASVLLGALGGASIAGRLGVGLVSRRVDVLALYRASLAAIAAALLLWLSADGQMVALWAFAVAYGVAYGCWVALLPAVSAQMFGLERLGVTLGVLFTSGAVGALVGVPAAGAVIDAGGYETAIGIAAAGAALSWLIVRPLGAVTAFTRAQPAV
jgi:MFS family permease